MGGGTGALRGLQLLRVSKAVENPMAGKIQVWTGIVAALLGFTTVAQGQQDDFPPEDKVIIRDYVLTADKFEGFIDGLMNLAAAKEFDGALALELDDIDREPAETLAALRAQVTGHRRVFEFYQDRD
jgi:hypothetical protein